MQVVRTDSGYISGTVLGDPDKPVRVFRGIPYAAPPLGDLRWKPPQPVAPWSGMRECTAFSARAPQSNPPDYKSNDPRPESEDCLYLNVLTPARTSAERLPVMVWFHPGALIVGTANDSTFNATPLPSHGVVLVNVNSRLGPLGLLAHPLLSRESPNGVSGNYLFLDLVAALKWVQRNISAFGGSPDNVTIFGESGGSTKVVNLMASPLAKGLFHRAIGQSECGMGTSLAEMESRGRMLFSRLGVDGEPDPLAAARALPWQKIIEAGCAVTADLKVPWGPPWSAWDSTVDGWFLPDTPAEVFQSGKQNVVPMILGATLGEVTVPGWIWMPWVIPGYVRLFKGASSAGGRAYAYIFDHVPAGWKRLGAVCSHGRDLTYPFGDLDRTSPYWMMPPPGITERDPGFTDADRSVSETMMTMWTNFARTGDPCIPGVLDWPAWDEVTDRYLYITEKPQVRSGFSNVGQK